MMFKELDLATIRERLAGCEYVSYKKPTFFRRGAVAAILRQIGDQTEVLFILRAERAGDPWSGHMAFPGGHVDSVDTDLYATAVRETKEEVGVDLKVHGELIGRLDDLETLAPGKSAGTVVTPYVFGLLSNPEFSISSEVAEMIWAPLLPMVKGEIDAIEEVQVQGERMEFPAFDIKGHFVWGLTYRILNNLFMKIASSS